VHARNLVGDVGHNGERRTDSPIPDTVSPSSESGSRLPCSHGPLPVVIIRRDVPMDSDRRALNVPADCRTLLHCVDGEPCASGPADAHNRHRPRSRDTLPLRSHGPRLHVRPSDTLRHYEHAHLLSNIEKLPLPILGSMFPFWNPTGVFLRSVATTRRKGQALVVCCFPSIHVLRRQPRRRVRGPRAPLARSTWVEAAQHNKRYYKPDLT
jgi:hypothetical protein